MLNRIDKAIVTNLKALGAKYGQSGLTKIRAAVDALIQADDQRGLVSQLVALDDAGVMKRVAGKPVLKAGDVKKNKAAIDAIYKALAPDYILILGATDVVPHQDLKNPVYSPAPDGDHDKIAYGDLPYACEEPYSQKPQDFLGPTRVVGRLPDLTGGTNPEYLIKVLGTAASYNASDPKSFYVDLCPVQS